MLDLTGGIPCSSLYEKMLGIVEDYFSAFSKPEQEHFLD